jgi:hypothetical protein
MWSDRASMLRGASCPATYLNSWLSMDMTAWGEACLLAAVNPAMSAGHGRQVHHAVETCSASRAC